VKRVGYGAALPSVATEDPTAAWTAQQIVTAFPDETAPAYLLRDRDRIFGEPFRRRMNGLGIEEVLTAPQSPWQNPFVERLIGPIISTLEVGGLHHRYVRRAA
jgi:putative transposase